MFDEQKAGQFAGTVGMEGLVMTLFGTSWVLGFSRNWARFAAAGF